jgi:glycosyltransferase involved in cell wall biosynthesis
VPTRISIVYIIDYFYRTGGTEKHLAQLIQRLPRDTFECSLVGFDLGTNPLLDELRAGGIAVVHIPVGREYVPNAALQAVRLYRLLKNLRADIVQTYHQKADTYGALIARAAGVQHIISSKRDTGQLRRPRHVFLNRRFASLFERVIVVADAVGDAVTANDGIDAARIVKIYNGVDTQRFLPATPMQRSEERSRLALRPDDFVVGMVAGFRPEKNHDIFFEGLRQAAAAIPTLKILAVGGGPLLERYRAQYANNCFGTRIIFTGDVPDVFRYLYAMDVACLVPGGNEGFSNAVLESMAVGLPMVVTNVGGNPEAVVDGANGFVIPPRDVGEFSRAIVRMHSEPALREAMGARSRQRVEEKFSLTAMCNSHARLYESLCVTPRSGAASAGRPG